MKAVLCYLRINMARTNSTMNNVLNSCFYSESGKKPFTLWNVMQFFNLEENNEKAVDYACILLNTPINNEKLLKPIWNQASFKLVVDGGSNHLFSMIQKCQNISDENFSIPNVVSGDFDSADRRVLEFFKKKNSLIIHTPNQNETDFFKAVEIVVSTTKMNVVVVSCDNVGRLDHIMGNLNVLYRIHNDPRMKNLKVFILSKDSLSWVLKPGKHVIQIPPSIWSENSFCSLIPLGHACHHVSTSGLKWNLNDSTLEFGGVVSTSNTYDVSLPESIVCISTNELILWNMTL